ncbi:MAG: hypothetical protein JW741_09840 [Sedimentisphaerales bacterium]|nr:hypothetical protein [Sedimentisphaerales bacterium]
MIRKQMILWALMAAAISCYAEGDGPPDPDPNRFAKDIENFAAWDSKNAVPADPILFVGSSSIRMWRTHESFPDLPVINRGFGGSHISDVIHFAKRIVLPYAPQMIVFYAGDNDVAGRKSPPRILADYQRFVRLVHARLPRTPIVFITIKPSGRRWSLWSEMDQANDLIRDFSMKDERLFFADLATPLLTPEGTPDNGFFLKDQLHLNTKGYTVWTRALKPVMRQALARTK